MIAVSIAKRENEKPSLCLALQRGNARYRAPVTHWLARVTCVTAECVEQS